MELAELDDDTGHKNLSIDVLGDDDGQVTSLSDGFEAISWTRGACFYTSRMKHFSNSTHWGLTLVTK